MRPALLGCLLLFCGCPSARKATVDLSHGGVEWVYRTDLATASMEDLRRVSEARLAAAQQPARVVVEGRTLKVQLPPMDATNAAFLQQLLSTPAHLEFREVDDGAWLAALEGKEPPGVTVSAQQRSGTGNRRTVLLKDVPPPAAPDGVAWVHGLAAKGEPVEYTPVKGKGLDNSSIKSAEAERSDQTGSWEVSLAFTEQGTKDFEATTTRLVNHCLGIVLDDRLLMAPVVMEPIKGGHARVTLGRGPAGDDKEREARTLAIALKIGALPAPLVMTDERVLPPTP